MNLDSYFEAQGRKLSADLASARAAMDHSGNKGTAAEAALREFLNRHLPRRFEVGHGEVTNSKEQRSGSPHSAGQLDVIVIDDSQPRFSLLSEPGLYFIEAVMAAGEVKANLKLSDVPSIIAKASAFKGLRDAGMIGDEVATNDHDLDRFVERRPYFLFAYESDTPLESFWARAVEEETERGLSATDHLDAIFFLDRGQMINLGSGRGAMKASDSSGNPLQGWIIEERPVMVGLIGWLSSVMPLITRRNAILPKYILPRPK